MKRIITIAVFLLAATALFAQTQGGRNAEEPFKKEFERIQAEKIAFITQELDLSPEEAQLFWPVYNQCWKEARQNHREMMKAIGEFRGGKVEELPEKELEAKLEAYIEAYGAESRLLMEYYPRFKKVLPIRKVAKLYLAEEAFQQKMIKNLRRHEQNPRKPAPGPGENRDRDRKDKK